ncbi:hypothetical protein ACFOVU_28130 [Nocardiopsis sediminis]|uniref:DUF4365 domain-containing protein n=1 Tax=Nocardiopsis sediminis TaxID=1778267 RepID=A0ABV8FUI1_9ACTN
MPSLEHEVPLDMIRKTPGVAVEMLGRVSTGKLPDYARVRCDSGDATNINPAELRVDSLIVCEDADGNPQLAIIVEVQLRTAQEKRRSWPQYATNIHARLGCPVELLVVAPSESVAEWCATTIDFGCGEVRPVALPLTRLEPYTDPDDAARHPDFAILAAAASRTEDETVLKALAPTLNAYIKSAGPRYAEYVYAALSPRAKKYLEGAVKLDNMDYQMPIFQQPFREGKAEGRAEGKTEAKVESILQALDIRAISLSDADRERISSCTELGTLDMWFVRALTVGSAEELFR